MQVNHLAPALLTMLLLPSLRRGAPSRVINVNSDVSVKNSVENLLVILDLGSEQEAPFFNVIFSSCMFGNSVASFHNGLDYAFRLWNCVP